MDAQSKIPFFAHGNELIDRDILEVLARAFFTMLYPLLRLPWLYTILYSA